MEDLKLEVNAKKKKNKWIKIVVLVGILLLAGLLVWLYFRLRAAGNLYMFESVDALRTYIKGFGAWAPIIFFFVQTLQVILAPIPGNVTSLAGSILFGFWKGFALGIGGMVLGAIIAYFIARMLGKPVVKFLVGEKVVDKYINAFSTKYVGVLFLIFLLPFFPDDALCFIAGLAGIPFPLFLIMVLVGRTPGMLFTSLVGSGIVVMPWWGWVLIGIASLGLVYLSIKYSSKVEDFFFNKLGLNRPGEKEHEARR